MAMGRVFLAGESDSYICEWLWQTLHVRECEVVRSDSLNTLLAEAGRAQLPRLVLLHTALGGNRVYDFCRVFKSRFPTVPLILLTDRVEPRVRQWALLQGATDLLAVTTEGERKTLLQQLDLLLTLPITSNFETIDSKQRTCTLDNFDSEVKVEAIVTALNQLSKSAAQYLGKLIVTNYWRSTRDELSSLGRVLQLFTVEFGQDVRFKENREHLTSEEAQAVRRWVRAFMERAQDVVQDLPELLNTAPLTSEQRQVLALSRRSS